MIIEFVVMAVIALSTVLALMQRDLMKAVIIIGFQGLGLAFMYQRLLAADVAITQAILGAALVPGLMIVTILKTRRIQE